MQLTKALYDKVHDAFNNQRLIGNVQYSDAEFEELLAYTSEYSRTVACGVSSYLYGENEVHFVTLVEIAKRWKNDDDSDTGFWAYVFDVILNGGYNQKLYHEFTDLIRSLALNQKILIADTAKWYYATIMMHALAPFNSMSAFLDLAFNIYKRDLDYNYTNSDRFICEIATDGFCSVAQKFGNSNVDISIGSSSYGIKVGLRSLALGETTRTYFVDLLDKAFHQINSLRHNITPDVEDYFTYLVNLWWSKKSEKEAEPDDDHEAPEQQFLVKFVRKDSKVYLRIPQRRRNFGESINLWLSLYVGEDQNPTISREIFTRTGVFTVISEQQDIELNSLLREAEKIHLRVEISENGKVIFNKTVDEDFLLFGNENEMTGKILRADNYFVYSLSIDNLQTPNEIYTVVKNLYNIYPNIGETLSGKTKQVVFMDKSVLQSNNLKIQLVGEAQNCAWTYHDTQCKVFCNSIKLFVPSNMSVNGLDLRINGNTTLLSKLNYDIEEGYLIYDITNLIPKHIPCEFVVFSYSNEKELIRENIVSIQGLHIKFSKSYYYGNDERHVRLNAGNEYRDLTWEQYANEVYCVICKGRLTVQIPQLKWKIDANDWHYGPIENKIWYKDYFHNGSALYVDAPISFDKIQLFCVGDGNEEEIPYNSLTKRFEIGRFIFSNEGRRDCLFLLKFSVGEASREICDVVTVEGFTQVPPLIVDNDELHFLGDKCFVGDRKQYFNICLKSIGREDKNFKSSDLIDGIIPNIEEGIYWVTVSAGSGGLFANKEKTYWEDEFVFGDKDKLKLSKLVLKINPIQGLATSDSWKWLQGGYYISHLIRDDSNKTYLAELYCLDASGNKFFVDGVTKCKVIIDSAKALSIFIDDGMGNSVQLKRDNSGNIHGPQFTTGFSIYRYNYEVKNV